VIAGAFRAATRANIPLATNLSLIVVQTAGKSDIMTLPVRVRFIAGKGPVANRVAAKANPGSQSAEQRIATILDTHLPHPGTPRSNEKPPAKTASRA
jgi:hypothetical protein